MQTTPAAAMNGSVINVQAIPPHQRHPLIIETVQRIAPGDSVTLVNDCGRCSATPSPGRIWSKGRRRGASGS